MSSEEEQLSELLTEAINGKMQHHRQQEQQQVDALLASQKHLTSNLRTLINSLDTILQLSTPRYNNSQGDLVGSCVNKARTLGTKLDLVGARLVRVQEHLERQEAELGLIPPAAAAADASAGTSTSDTAMSDVQQQQEQQQVQQEQKQEAVQGQENTSKPQDLSLQPVEQHAQQEG